MVGWHPLKVSQAKMKISQESSWKTTLSGWKCALTNLLSRAIHLDFPGPQDILDILVFLEFWAFLDFWLFFLTHLPFHKLTNTKLRQKGIHRFVVAWVGLEHLLLDAMNVYIRFDQMFFAGWIECFWPDGWITFWPTLHSHATSHFKQIWLEVLFHQFVSGTTGIMNDCLSKNSSQGFVCAN